MDDLKMRGPKKLGARRTQILFRVFGKSQMDKESTWMGDYLTHEDAECRVFDWCEEYAEVDDREKPEFNIVKIYRPQLCPF